jgi:hypothetical protein
MFLHQWLQELTLHSWAHLDAGFALRGQMCSLDGELAVDVDIAKSSVFEGD